jgi:metal-responsive CopG/Arc/MetJ family transcriptional regulator
MEEIHFNADEELVKRFKRALRKSGFSTQSEYFRSKMRELADTVDAKRESSTLERVGR